MKSKTKAKGLSAFLIVAISVVAIVSGAAAMASDGVNKASESYEVEQVDFAAVVQEEQEEVSLRAMGDEGEAALDAAAEEPAQAEAAASEAPAEQQPANTDLAPAASDPAPAPVEQPAVGTEGEGASGEGADNPEAPQPEGTEPAVEGEGEGGSVDGGEAIGGESGEQPEASEGEGAEGVDVEGEAEKDGEEEATEEEESEEEESEEEEDAELKEQAEEKEALSSVNVVVQMVDYATGQPLTSEQIGSGVNLTVRGFPGGETIQSVQLTSQGQVVTIALPSTKDHHYPGDPTYSNNSGASAYGMDLVIGMGTYGPVPQPGADGWIPQSVAFDYMGPYQGNTFQTSLQSNGPASYTLVVAKDIDDGSRVNPVQNVSTSSEVDDAYPATVIMQIMAGTPGPSYPGYGNMSLTYAVANGDGTVTLNFSGIRVGDNEYIPGYFMFGVSKSEGMPQSPGGFDPDWLLYINGTPVGYTNGGIGGQIFIGKDGTLYTANGNSPGAPLELHIVRVAERDGSGFSGPDKPLPPVPIYNPDGSGVSGSGVTTPEGSGVAGSGVSGSGVAGSGVAGPSGSGTDSAELIPESTPKVRSISVTKVWDDSDNADDLREDVVFQLQSKVGSDGEWTDVPDQVQTVSKDATGDELTVTFEDLPMYDESGVEIQYQVAELDMTGYVSSTTGDDKAGFTVTNTHEVTTDLPPQSGDNPDPEPDPEPVVDPDPEPETGVTPDPKPEPQPEPVATPKTEEPKEPVAETSKPPVKPTTTKPTASTPKTSPSKSPITADNVSVAALVMIVLISAGMVGYSKRKNDEKARENQRNRS